MLLLQFKKTSNISINRFLYLFIEIFEVQYDENVKFIKILKCRQFSLKLINV